MNLHHIKCQAVPWRNARAKLAPAETVRAFLFCFGEPCSCGYHQSKSSYAPAETVRDKLGIHFKLFSSASSNPDHEAGRRIAGYRQGMASCWGFSCRVPGPRNSKNTGCTLEPGGKVWPLASAGLTGSKLKQCKCCILITGFKQVSSVQITFVSSRKKRSIIHDPPSTLTYVHTPTNPTQNDSRHPWSHF